MAAAVVTKNGLVKAPVPHHTLHFLRRRTCSKHSMPDPTIVNPKNIGNHIANQLVQSKWCSNFPHSVLRKAKELDFYSPIVISSIFSSKGSSSTYIFKLVRWYLEMIRTRPVATKSITSAFIYAAADLSSQSIVGENPDGYDLVRTLRMSGYGMLIIGPSLHYWFNFVSKVYPKRDLLSTFKKMALGQMVYGPCVTCIFFSANAALQGESCSEIIDRLKRDLIPTLISGIMYWPLCDFLTFKFIPVHLQPLVSNSFSYLWTIYLTYMASLAKVSTS